MRLGERLTVERKKRNLSSEELAKKCGVSRSFITLIENGKRLPSTKVLPKIALILNLKTTTVLNLYLGELKVKIQKSLKDK